MAAEDEHPGMERLLFGRLLPVLVASRELMTVEELAWAVGAADIEDVSVGIGAGSRSRYGWGRNLVIQYALPVSACIIIFLEIIFYIITGIQ